MSKEVTRSTADTTQPSPRHHEHWPVNSSLFPEKHLVAGAAATVSAGILAKATPAFSQEAGPGCHQWRHCNPPLSRRSRNSRERLWVQYNELGGTQDDEESGANGPAAPLYMQAFRRFLDGDMDAIHPRQYGRREESLHFHQLCFLNPLRADPSIYAPSADPSQQQGHGTHTSWDGSPISCTSTSTPLLDALSQRQENPDLDSQFCFCSSGEHHEPHRDSAD